MSKMSPVWVFSDSEERLAELISGAVGLGESVNVLAIGTPDDAATAISYGANAVYLFTPQVDVIAEEYIASFASIIQAKDPSGIILLPASRRGKALGAKLAVELRSALVNEATSISVGGGVLATHLVYGGLAVGVEKIQSPYAIITVSTGAYEPAIQEAARKGEIHSVGFIPRAKPIRCIERKAKPTGSIDLKKAKRVVSVGRGFSQEDDLHLARELAQAIGAEMGCSRPIAEGEGWMERERYVGVSGAMLKSDLYVALGISGQVQHMVGANGAKVIVAVNKDKNAPIFSSADFGLVGDIYKVVPALTAALKG